MAKKERLAISAGNARESAKESMIQRALRIDGSCNGTTLRTRVIRNKKLYNRNIKHRKSFAEAGDSPFSWSFLCSSGMMLSFVLYIALKFQNKVL